MATVRITEKLIHDTLATVRQKFEPALEAAKASLDTTGWADRIYETLYREYLPQINALPADFFDRREGVSLKTGNSLFEARELTLRFAAPRPMPQAMPENPYMEFIQSWRPWEYRVKSWGAWPDMEEAYNAWTARVKRVLDDREAMKVSVHKLLRSHSTLAPCIKKWPALWDLLSDEYRDRHRVVAERKAKDGGPEYDLDFDRMTAMVAKAKLRGV